MGLKDLKVPSGLLTQEKPGKEGGMHTGSGGGQRQTERTRNYSLCISIFLVLLSQFRMRNMKKRLCFRSWFILFSQSSVPWLLSRFKICLYAWCFPKADGDFMDIRGYYRCSSSKGCSARKQVERSRTDPNMLVITYTSEHNHPWPTQRNALAGSTRSHPFKNALNIPGDDVLKSPTAPKEERREATTSNAHLDLEQEQEEGEMDKPTEDDDFNQNMHRSYKPMIPEADQPDDFFADLAELETDPMSLIFSKGYMDGKPDEERGAKASDAMDTFDWAASS
ncbi:hypothetical protein BHM03_00008653 [Ensete ventricosum]|nr:hypothetical protein BHM03_00008653 [Ensete ventricosum]